MPTPMLSFTDAPPMNHNKSETAAAELPALTALRGIAALAVVFFHASFIAYHYAGGGVVPTVWRRGYLAVDLFFFLSGFVLTHVYASRLGSGRGWRAIGQFFWARFCRIYPASLFTIAVYALLYASGRLYRPEDFSFGTQMLASLTLMQVPWLHQVYINPPAWSVSAEWYTYLLFPLLLPAVMGLERRTAALLGSLVLLLVAAGHLPFTHEQQNWGWGALARAFLEFTAGVFGYRAYRDGLFCGFWQKDVTLIGIVAGLAVALISGVSDALLVVLLLALLLAAASNSGRMSHIFKARPLQWLGDVSYSVYIFQSVPFMLAVRIAPALAAHGLTGVRFEALAVSLALAGAVLVHRCIDVPARAALRRLPDRLAIIRSRRSLGAVAGQGRAAEGGR